MLTRNVTCKLLFIISLVFLSACSTPGPSFSPVQASNAMALVYIYYLPSGRKTEGFSLKANGKKLAVLQQGEYYPYTTKPGTIEFETQLDFNLLSGLMVLAASGPSIRTLEVEAGKTYYLEASYEHGVLVKKFHLSPVPDDLGASQINFCTLAR